MLKEKVVFSTSFVGSYESFNCIPHFVISVDREYEAELFIHLKEKCAGKNAQLHQNFFNRDVMIYTNIGPTVKKRYAFGANECGLMRKDDECVHFHLMILPEKKIEIIYTLRLLFETLEIMMRTLKKNRTTNAMSLEIFTTNGNMQGFSLTGIMYLRHHLNWIVEQCVTSTEFVVDIVSEAMNNTIQNLEIGTQMRQFSKCRAKIEENGSMVLRCDGPLSQGVLFSRDEFFNEVTKEIYFELPHINDAGVFLILLSGILALCGISNTV